MLLVHELLLLRLALTIHRTIPCASARTGAIARATSPALPLSLPFAFAPSLTEARAFGTWSALRTVAAILLKTLCLTCGAFLGRFWRAAVTAAVSRAVAREGGHSHSAK